MRRRLSPRSRTRPPEAIEESTVKVRYRGSYLIAIVGNETENGEALAGLLHLGVEIPGEIRLLVHHICVFGLGSLCLGYLHALVRLII